VICFHPVFGTQVAAGEHTEDRAHDEWRSTLGQPQAPPAPSGWLPVIGVFVWRKERAVSHVWAVSRMFVTVKALGIDG